MLIKYLNPDNVKRSGLSPRKVAQAATKLLRLTYQWRYYDPDLQSKVFVDNLKKRIINGQSLPFLAMAGKKIVASSFLELDGWGRAELAKSVVHENYRQTNVGKKLMRMRLPYIKRRLNLDLAYVKIRMVNPAAAAITLGQGFVPVALWFENPVRDLRGGISYREPILFAEYYLGKVYEAPEIFAVSEGLPWIDYVEKLVGSLPAYSARHEILSKYSFDDKNAVHYFTNHLPDDTFTAKAEEETVLLFDVSRDTLALQIAARNKGFAVSGYLPPTERRPPRIIFTKGASPVVPAVFPAGNYGFLAESLPLLIKERPIISSGP